MKYQLARWTQWITLLGSFPLAIVAGDKDGPLTEAQFKDPNSIAISPDGSLYISEFSVNRIRKITGLEN